MKAKKFLLSFVTILGMLLLLQAPFNACIDPYNVVIHGKITGFNESTREFSRRITAPYQSENLDGNGLILGSSRALALNAWPYFPPDSNIRWSNLWINMANINELRRTLQQAVAFNDVKIAIIGLDFEGFNANNIRTGPFETRAYSLTQEGKYNVWHMFSQLELYFSLSTTRASMLILGDNIASSALISTVRKAFGTSVHSKDAPVGNPTIPPTSRAQEERAAFEEMNKVVGGFTFEDWERGVSTFKDMRAIVRTCQQKGVRLLLFINPEHVASLEAYRQVGCWASYTEWLRQLAAIVAQCNSDDPAHHVDLWCYAGYSEVNASYVGPDIGWKNNYYGDMGHFAPLVGQFILDQATGQHVSSIPIPEGFGIVLTPENVEHVIHTMDVERGIYLEKAKAWK